MTAEPGDEDGGAYNSPACAAHLLDDAYLGYAPVEEIVACLDALLDRKQDRGALARRLENLIPRVRDRELRSTLTQVLQGYQAFAVTGQPSVKAPADQG